MSAPPRGFRRLAAVTAGATLVLIVLGGIVRLSDSGLGCGPAGSGFHGWPLCRGDIVPGLDLNAVIEYSHRALASVVGLLAIALAVWAVRRLRGHRGIVRASVGGAVLVVVQGLLGALVVEENLQEALVAAHLGLAMLLLAVTLYLVRSSRPDVIGAEPPAGVTPGLRRLAVAAAGAVLATIVAGGYVAGTEGY
ncbi:MAG: COX15/CtaA family protein, partial [Chloroflexota bacterium]|nr:COX15/CtaA family protein [Chloroflexota bacterium]